MNTEYNYVAHAAFLLLAFSYLIRDVLYLRTIAVTASVCMILFNVLAYPHPIWVIIQWNLAFIAINLMHIGWLMGERFGVRLSDQEQQLHDVLFPHLEASDFRRLMRIARWEEIGDAQILVEQGSPGSIASLLYLYRGRAVVIVDGKQVATLRDGAFIGEMSFLSDRAPSATVRTEGSCRLVAWPRAELSALIGRHAGLRLALQQVLARDVVAKLSRQALRAA